MQTYVCASSPAIILSIVLAFHSAIVILYDTIGDTSAGMISGGGTVIGNAETTGDKINDILFVVYTERAMMEENGQMTDVTRLISARLATNFERGLY